MNEKITTKVSPHGVLFTLGRVAHYQIQRPNRAKITSQPQMAFRPTRLIISGDASKWRLWDIRIGNAGQLSQYIGNGLPGELFTSTAPDVGMAMDIAQAGMDIRLEIENLSDEPLTFHAAMMGQDVDGRPLVLPLSSSVPIGGTECRVIIELDDEMLLVGFGALGVSLRRIEQDELTADDIKAIDTMNDKQDLAHLGSGRSGPRVVMMHALLFGADVADSFVLHLPRIRDSYANGFILIDEHIGSPILAVGYAAGTRQPYSEWHPEGYTPSWFTDAGES